MKYIQFDQSSGDLIKDDPGIGQDSQEIRRYVENLVADYYRPLSRQWANPVIRFENLLLEWKDSTAMLSSITEISMHPSYQQIIGMGTTAIPLILLSMRQEPDHWFWALRSITGENPVSEEHQGKITKMNEAWLEWGKRHLYLE